ncbi:hypothetical protein VRU48_19500 [Pedobacter sp. KR3-3]|uniref:Uncharacterized protein n=1 Tax=Pedobacter albus TaxID=3113905 RepID=A0ABU7IDF4_9SPHI|nr:hypothetical protein [Pedobacter sp. KR3-3]MEE1947321.1 hypothetical protein [Pedobacter sp. KR3-3]
MIQFELLDLARKQLPNLDLNQESDVIRLEKILKAEIKLNNSININDVEQLLDFLRKDGGRFAVFFQNKTIRTILNAKGETINFAPFDRRGLSDETLNSFAEIFASNVEAYLRECIRAGAWFSLKSLFINYSFLVQDSTRENIRQLLTLKNKSIIQAIYTHQFVSFIDFNRFCRDAGYYGILSIVDPSYFDQDILEINNAIYQNQETTVERLKLLGEVLYALTYYNAHSEDLQATLANNQPVALKWSSLGQSTSSSSDNHTMIIVSYVAAAIFIIILMAAGVGGVGIFIPVVIAIARLASRNSR